MKTSLLKLRKWILVHKKISVLIFIILTGVTYGSVKIFSNDIEETRYIIGVVERGDIITMINGTGQVSASNQVDVSSKSSGDLIYLNAKSGQEVKTGNLIAQVDPGDALFELESAKISYKELTDIDPDDIAKAKTDVEVAYTDARSTLTNTSSDFSDAITMMDELFHGYLGYKQGRNKIENQYIDTAGKSFSLALEAVETFQVQYDTLNNKTTNIEIDSMIKNAYEAVTKVFEASKDAKDAVMYIRDHDDEDNAEADEAYSSINELVASVSINVSSIVSSRDTVREINEALQDLENGPDTLALRSEELSLRQKQDAYENYFIRAPFDGIIASVDVKKGQNVNTGTTIATFITKQKVAEISLNEIDVAKVRVGQKATLTFDAFENLNISGEVVEVDLVGAVSQGVVNYTVKIGFDTDDDQVKPGMTVSADIITETKENVLTVASSAIKTASNRIYVEVVERDAQRGMGVRNTGIILSTLPTQVSVVTGLSDDTSVEIISGLKEGDQYVVRTIVGTTTTTTTTVSPTPTLFGSGRSTGVGGNRATLPR